MASQGEYYPLSSQVADFHLNWSMLMENPKNNITGRSRLFPKTSRPKVQFDANTYYPSIARCCWS